MRPLLGVLLLAVGCSTGQGSAPATTIALPAEVVGARGATSASYGANANEILFMIWPPAAPRIMQSRRVSSGWSSPQPALRGVEFLAIGPAVSPDGKQLYFESNHRQPPIAGRTDTDLWIADRDGDAWVNARPVGAPFDTEFQEHNVTVSARGTICLNSRRPGGLGDHDIYCATRTGTTWSAPVNAGASVNSASLDGAPHIDAGERFMVFGSNRPGGAGGDDLYVSLRVNGQWQPAVNLGPSINTADGEWAPAVSPDGRRLLFTRTVGERAAARSTLIEVPFDASRYRANR